MLTVLSLLTTNCSKDDDPAVNYSETLKDTIWTGFYYNLPGEFPISYTITLNNTDGFEFVLKEYDNVDHLPYYTTILGTWTVSENIVTFKFSTGAQNIWSGQIEGDKIINITDPVPANFRFISCIKTK